MECYSSLNTIVVRSLRDIVKEKNVVVEQRLVYGRWIDSFNSYLFYIS